MPIKRDAVRQFREQLLAKRLLALQDQVMHVPDLAMCRDKRSGFGGGLGVWMYFSQREVSKDKPQLFSQLLLKLFDDRVCVSTARAFVVAIFDQSARGVGGTLRVVGKSDWDFQRCHNNLISEDSRALRESRRRPG